MLSKLHRVSGKEVRFLTKKRQIFSRGLFTAFFVDQYPNRKFHQLSFHIPLSISKRAVHRHKIKRILISLFENSITTQAQWDRFYKCFITLNKQKIEYLTNLILQKNNSEIKTYLNNERHHFFTSFFLSSHGQKNNSKSDSKHRKPAKPQSSKPNTQ